MRDCNIGSLFLRFNWAKPTRMGYIVLVLPKLMIQPIISSPMDQWIYMESQLILLKKKNHNK